jgi:hypothetical protein
MRDSKMAKMEERKNLSEEKFNTKWRWFFFVVAKIINCTKTEWWNTYLLRKSHSNVPMYGWERQRGYITHIVTIQRTSNYTFYLQHFFYYLMMKLWLVFHHQTPCNSMQCWDYLTTRFLSIFPPFSIFFLILLLWRAKFLSVSFFLH